MGEPLIHPTAIVDPNAQIAKDASVGPYSIVGPEVVIGEQTVVENHVTIKGKTTIGCRNIIGPYTSIGLSAQDKAHRNEPTQVVIGDDNEIREYVSINRGTFNGTGITKVGNNNQIMAHAHLAHDSSIENSCMLANATTLAGHVQMGSFVVTGGVSGVHQFCRIGDYAMLGGYSVAYQDIPPYMMCVGYRAELLGLNRVGLERNGITADEINQIQKIYSIYFCSGMVPKIAIDALKKELPASPILDRFIDFTSTTKRGLVSKA